MEKLDFKDDLDFNEFPSVSIDEWEAVIEADLKGKNYKEVLRWSPEEGLDALPFYRKDHLKNIHQNANPVRSSGSWNIIEPVDDADISTANSLALEALENGASGLNFNLKAERFSTRNDLEQLLENVQIDIITLKFGPSLSIPQIAKWVNEICKERNLESKKYDIHFSFDPFSNALQTGKLAAKKDLQHILKEFESSFKYCLVDSAPYGNSGATVIQQIAFALAAGNEFLGLGENTDTSGHTYFNFSAGPHYFPEIAKYRAFKLMWKQVLQEYKVEDSRFSIHAETALWNKSRTDAHNNMIRTTTEAMSAALGGCDAVTVHRYDKHFEKASGFSSRIARNIQLILQEEAYLNKVADPGAGSYYIEVLTDKIARESWELFQKIESKGGFYECIKSGFIQSEINKSKEEKISAYKEKQKVLVGVNKYTPGKIQNSKFKIQNLGDFEFSGGSFLDIQKIEPLNIEAVLQMGEG
ncbi:MAG: hypothetical protein HUJ22_10185 [Gracilimonas sp.]|uniref:methylmalonyl-CoA mutase subunit beta n=1 Tax=Gracilimonas sp. TaxID=1974203 RepID=UPI0019B9082C|nr:methylmalonyl-CoA mutase subunit beta [Gracilimonas sp.]MBD3616929.1 hypothetical protein [Gracilimonas sp.]